MVLVTAIRADKLSYKLYINTNTCCGRSDPIEMLVLVFDSKISSHCVVSWEQYTKNIQIISTVQYNVIKNCGLYLAVRSHDLFRALLLSKITSTFADAVKKKRKTIKT